MRSLFTAHTYTSQFAVSREALAKFQPTERAAAIESSAGPFDAGTSPYSVAIFLTASGNFLA